MAYVGCAVCGTTLDQEDCEFIVTSYDDFSVEYVCDEHFAQSLQMHDVEKRIWAAEFHASIVQRMKDMRQNEIDAQREASWYADEMMKEEEN